MTNFVRHAGATLTFINSGLVSASVVAFVLGFGCSSSDSSPGAGGAGGQSGGRGGEAGAEEAPGGDGGSESAGAGGESGGTDDLAGAGSGGSSAAGTSNGGAGGSAGHATAGSSATGGGSGEECIWDPAASEHCPACSTNFGCERPGYKYVGSGAVTASCCLFEWQEVTASEKFSWLDASQYCANLSLLGRGWRLPKVAELYSLVDLSDESHTSPTINVEAFADTVREAYWSSSPEGRSGQSAWVVDFSDGASKPKAISDKYRVRCVR